MENPYRIPTDGRYRTINVSGGRSSAYMLYHLLDANDGQLPDDTLAVFANTGVERPETYDFIHECETRWGVDIVWLEYHYDLEAAGGRKEPRRTYKRVDHGCAARNGEPFREMIAAGSWLPNSVHRKCTAELKISTIDRYCFRELGWKKTKRIGVLGIRYDEPRRWGKALHEECQTEYPMVHARATKEDVSEFWAAQPFDLGIPSWKGNCTLCFMKGQSALIQAIRDQPEVADWWIETEEKWGSNNRTFSKKWTYRELVERARMEQDLPFDYSEDDQLGASCACTD